MTNKKHLMASILLLSSWQLQAAQDNTFIYDEANPSRAAGGPDAYGYTWADSDEVGGPVFSWIDITTVGTQVTGLADDNSVPMLPMGMTFQYYWINFSNIKIGSNGWLSFDDVSNVAHCFPTTPTAGGPGDNLIAPFMSDLNFTGAGNPGEVYYYHDAAEELFIVSYINAPWWVNANPAYNGSNTFQVIFSAVDNSITYQYLDMDPASFNDTPGCIADLEIGFENNTGDIGLEIFNEQVPADNYAIKISFPDEPLIDVIDVTPTWNQNEGNKAVFAAANTDYTLMTHVINNGSADTTDDITVTMNVLDQNATPVYSEIDTLTGLSAQQETDVVYPIPFNAVAGTYSLEVTSATTDDANPGNDVNTSELSLIDTNNSPIQLSYVTSNVPTGIQSWSGGTGGVGAYFKPPADLWQITSVELFISTGTPGGGLDFTAALYDNDNGDGLPGTLLSSVLVTGGSYTLDSWVTVELPTPIVAPSNGFYVSWQQDNADGMAIGSMDTSPISRQSYEFLGSQWSVFRSNETLDPMFRVNMIDLIFANGFE